MAIDLREEILEILNEIEKSKTKIIRYDILSSFFHYAHIDKYDRLIEENSFLELENILKFQTDEYIKELIIKLKNKLLEFLEIHKLIKRYENLKFTLKKKDIEERVSVLEEIEEKYLLFDDYTSELEFNLKINKRLLEFIKFKDELEKELFEENNKKINLEQYKNYFDKLHKFSDLKLEMSGLWGEPRNIISGIDIETQKLIFQMNAKMSREALKITEEKIKDLESQSLRNLTGFFFVFTLIASNITLIFKASENLNIFHFIALIFIINSILIFAVMTIFRVISEEKEKYNRTLWHGIIGMIIGIFILGCGAYLSGYGAISERILDKRINTKIEEVNIELDNLDSKIKSLENENKILNEKLEKESIKQD